MNKLIGIGDSFHAIYPQWLVAYSILIDVKYVKS